MNPATSQNGHGTDGNSIPEGEPVHCPAFVLPMAVKLGVQTELSGLKLCEALASTYRLCHSLDGCLEFWSSRRSRRVRS